MNAPERVVFEDPHTDKLSAGVELAPEPWDDPDDFEGPPICLPVIYVTGDAYLDPEQARTLADELRKMADEVAELRASDKQEANSG